MPTFYYHYCFYEAKLCLRKLILLLFFSQWTPLHHSAFYDRLEICRLLVESKADVAARDWCFSPPPSHHLSFTICLAAVAALHSNWPSATTDSTLLHTCAASARRNDAPPRPAALLRNKTQFLFVSPLLSGVQCSLGLLALLACWH